MIMVISCDHSTGGQQLLWKKISASHSFPRCQVQHKVCIDSGSSFYLLIRSGWALEDPLYLILISTGSDWNILIPDQWKPGASISSTMLFLGLYSLNQLSFLYSFIQHWLFTPCKVLSLNSDKILKIWIRNKHCHERVYNPVGPVRYNHK